MAEAMINDQNMSATLPTLLPQISQRETFSSDEDNEETTKVVDFDLPVPKRQRSSDPNITAKMVVAGIHNSVTKKDRLNAISIACVTFDHDVEAAHDQEISFGADVALCKHLAFLLVKRQSLFYHETLLDDKREEPSDYLPADLGPEKRDEELKAIEHEIGSTIDATEMVLRCSADSVLTSFNRIGAELLPLLLHIIKSDISFRKNNKSNPIDPDDVNASKNSKFTDGIYGIKCAIMETGFQEEVQGYVYGENCLKNSTKIIGHFARVGSLTEPLAVTNGMLSTLKYLIATLHGIIPIEAKLNSLWVIANLACNAENMVMMACHPGLVETLVQVISLPNGIDDNKVSDTRQYLEILRSRCVALRAILNLSWQHENKVPFSEHTDLVNSLLKTAQHRNSSCTGRGIGISGILLQSRRHAAGALRNLSAAPRRNKRHLCRYKDSNFLNILGDIAGNDPDVLVREKVHATLFNLVSADTAKMFTENSDVLDVIVNTAGKGNDSNEKKIITTAMRTLRTLEKALPEDQDGYTIIRNVLSRLGG
mmetsp:Transcript_14793/g.21140  ORF Transcript_14793/g.21140 Transcript_14793/m.21140 type:complete len:539 (-) Transcript_14793:193-1809(-)